MNKAAVYFQTTYIAFAPPVKIAIKKSIKATSGATTKVNFFEKNLKTGRRNLSKTLKIILNI
jgi:hypothetical protein